MKSLQTLLRIARRDLDVLRRALAERIAAGAAIEESMRTHEQAVRDEQKVAARDYESGRAYGGFAAVAVAGRRGLEAKAVAVEAESEQLRALITEAHVETRKFERLLELQKERAREVAQKREDGELDELTTQRGARFSQR